MQSASVATEDTGVDENAEDDDDFDSDFEAINIGELGRAAREAAERVNGNGSDDEPTDEALLEIEME